MKTSRPSPLFFLLPLLLISLSVPCIAGVNAGGTLVVHSLEMSYTGSGFDYCGVSPLSDCSQVDSRYDDPVGTVVWVLYAAFAEVNQPSLRGVEFGVQYEGLALADWGSCDGDYEQSMFGWPASGTGTMLTWLDARESRMVPVYWFAGYGYASAGRNSYAFSAVPHPIQGGYFGDGSIVPVLDPIAGYGTLGFNKDGEVPCPAPGTYRVRADGSGDFPTIQEAVAFAAPTSVIELEDGIYRGDGNRDIRLNQAEVTIRSVSDHPENCIIDCEGTAAENHRAFLVVWQQFQAERGCLLRGVTMKNGYGGEEFSYDREGGAIHQSGGTVLRVENCVFDGCISEKSGGAIASGGHLTVEGCIFRNNRALDTAGGAIDMGGEELVVRDCRFENNDVVFWGGAFRATNGDLTVEDCIFQENQAGIGGGVYLFHTDAVFERCLWYDNSATAAGAFYCNQGSTVLRRCTLSDNLAGISSAIQCEDSPTDLELSSTVVSFSAGGPVIDCGPAIVSAVRTDFFGNEGGDWIDCLAGQAGVQGNLNVDPLFCDRPGGNYYLRQGSLLAGPMDVRERVIGAYGVGCRGSAREDEATVESVASLSSHAIEVDPNPFLASVRIRIPAKRGAGTVPSEVTILDLAGRQVRALEDLPAGELSWDGRDDSGSEVPSGIYFCRVRVGSRMETVRLARIR